jgi:hypothetical protein
MAPIGGRNVPLPHMAFDAKSFESFLWQQILRIKQNLSQPFDPPSRDIGLTVVVGPARLHAAGPKKPSLTETENALK